jgi:hypothetical protein
MPPPYGHPNWCRVLPFAAARCSWTAFSMVTSLSDCYQSRQRTKEINALAWWSPGLPPDLPPRRQESDRFSSSSTAWPSMTCPPPFAGR